MQSIRTFLMFDGKAEEAINFYISAFRLSQIVEIIRYKVNEGGVEGTVKHATFRLKGQEFMCIDSNIKHNFTFTSSMSLFVNCDNENEIIELYEKLSDEGRVMMPLDTYPFSKKYCWICDKYGVPWQLSMAL